MCDKAPLAAQIQRGSSKWRADQRILRTLRLFTVAALINASSAAADVRKDKQPLPLTEIPLGKYQLSYEEWRTFLDENLEPDFAPWRARAPLKANDTAALLGDLLKRAHLPSVFQRVLIYNNRVYWPDREDVDGDELGDAFSPFKVAFHKTIQGLLLKGRLKLPNVVFVFNSEDNRPRWCGPSAFCPVPLLSLGKTLGDMAATLPPEQENGEVEEAGEDRDILIPQFVWFPRSFYHYPWSLKKDLAYFRGIPFCSSLWFRRMPCWDACPRAWLSWRSYRDKKEGRPPVLDVGLVEPYERPMLTDTKGRKRPIAGQCLSAELPLADRAPISDHTYYKWLLHLEGIAYSSRLSQLFYTNSVVLLQWQPWIEWFGRSIKPWVHYVPFWTPRKEDMNATMYDVYDTVQQLRQMDEQQPERLQRLVHNAQSFAMKYTTQHARVLYLKEVLKQYKELFEDMDEHIEAVLLPAMRKRGFRI